MNCQACGRAPATIHLTRVVDGEQEERHLCEDCARESGVAGFILEPTFSMQQLIAGLMGEPSAATGSRRATALRCEGCGLTLEEFSGTGRLGCPRCYQAFVRPLRPLIRRIHGDVEHTGKLPRRVGAEVAAARQVRTLRRELAEAVAAEAYERAAELRDAIRALEEANGREEG